ncbi:hypothetical protein [Actinomadura sp. KC216]|nr:hypothetical protein [Actinomadura sp. KC216]
MFGGKRQREEDKARKEQRVYQVNLRREFPYATPTELPEAEEFRAGRR